MRMAFFSLALSGILILALGAPRICANPEQKKERSEIVCVRKRDQGRTGNSNASQTERQNDRSGKTRS